MITMVLNLSSALVAASDIFDLLQAMFMLGYTGKEPHKHID